MDSARQLRSRKIAPWLHLAAGLLLVAAGVRSLKPGRHGDPWLLCVAGMLYLAVALKGFLNLRNNPEGKQPPTITTILGPQ